MSEPASQIRTILAGTDLDQDSRAVVGTALALARAAGARVHVLFAFNPPVGFFSELGAGLDPAVLAEEQRLCREALADQVREAGIQPEELHGQTVRSGAPHRLLAGMAAEIDAGLVVLGATAGGRLRRRLGSTADRMLRVSSRPVLIVRGDLPIPPRKVLAPVDLSPLSAEAFRAGLDILNQVGGGAAPEVEALFVLSVLQRQVAPQFTAEQVDRFAAQELQRFVEANGMAADSVRRKVRTGNVREEIFAEIAAARPDLVLLGTHGLGGFDRFVIGSVAADVTREAPCSVLVVPPAAMKE